MIRYKEVTEDVLVLANSIQQKYFPELVNVKIKYLFDLKRRIVEGRLCLGRCIRLDDLVKHFTIEESQNEEGYHYVITLDEVAYTNIDEKDRERLIRHEQRHILYLGDESKNPYKLEPHDLSDFEAEVILNVDDPGWSKRVADLIFEIYEQKKEMEQEA